ncbi:MAG: tRNA lysidine(34) synthetase TilS [Acidobacteria bacterium]|nr:MAG: tRNA lysidine(34) synthetase TilS [Acidobacteriota bacterium]
MKPVLDVVRETIRRYDLARSDTRVVVALSGGSDSVALAHLIGELDAAGDLRAVGVAHFNHQLRNAADADERFCHSIAASLGWPILADRDDVAARARRGRRSVETAARQARYEFFARARSHFNADVVAVGHTRDDQAETFLLRLMRGAGPRGLAAMHPRNGPIIRPLLACRRGELRAYLEARRIAFVEDDSNRDVSIPRNRVRAELVGLLERRFNPAIVDVLADEAALARDIWEWMEAAADELSAQAETCSRSAQGDAGVWQLDISALRAAPLALRRLVVWRAMVRAADGRPVSFGHVEAALRLIVDEGGTSIDAPGQRVQRVGTRLVLSGRPPGAVGRPAPVSTATANFFHYPLSIPGEVQLPQSGCVVSAELVHDGEGAVGLGATGTGAAVAVRSDLCKGPLAVRNRRPGDRFRPSGLRGQKKLQDFFVDRKVARQERDAVPLVVDSGDRIVWVAGHSIDEAFRVTDPAQTVLILRLKQV